MSLRPPLLSVTFGAFIRTSLQIPQDRLRLIGLSGRVRQLRIQQRPLPQLLLRSKTEAPRQVHGASGFGSGYDASNAATLSVIGIFVAIFFFHEEDTMKTSRSSRSKTNPFDLDTQYESSITKHIEIPSLMPLQSLLKLPNLSYNVAGWHPSLWTDKNTSVATKAKASVPYIMYNFAHFSPGHLIFDSITFYSLSMAIMPAFGVVNTLAFFLTSGVMASQIHCFVDKAYATNLYPHVFKYLKSPPRDPDPQATLYVRGSGASSALYAMLAVTAIVRPKMAWNLMFIPIGIPAWFLTIGLVGWDAYSWSRNVKDGIGHGGHLSGFASGLVLWAVWVRWTRFGRLMRMR